MDERGVSPVIGVILMVAITVILAAVIASFVLGFGDSVSQNTQAGVSIDAEAGPSDGQVVVTWVSQGNANSVDVNISDTSGNINASGSAVNSNPAAEFSSVGQTVTLEETTSGDTTFTITVTAEGDGGTTVVSQRQVTI